MNGDLSMHLFRLFLKMAVIFVSVTVKIPDSGCVDVRAGMVVLAPGDFNMNRGSVGAAKKSLIKASL